MESLIYYQFIVQLLIFLAVLLFSVFSAGNSLVKVKRPEKLKDDLSIEISYREYQKHLREIEKIKNSIS